MKYAKLWTTLLCLTLSACASTREVKKQDYAELKGSRNFEYELPVVWKAVEKAFGNHKITKRTPADDEKAKERKLETDWVYSQSRDKYVEYKINGTPRKQYLQTRLMYKVVAKRIMGGTDVDVQVLEEIERLKEDGSSGGYTRVDQVDTSRSSEMLERVNLALLSAAP